MNHTQVAATDAATPKSNEPASSRAVSTVAARGDETNGTNRRPDVPPNFGGSDLVTILLGEAKVRYHIHEDVLVTGCPFFAKCLSSGMRESETKLPEETCRQFNLFTFFIYKGNVEEIGDDETVEDVLDAWILAEKFSMPRWQDRVVDAMLEYWEAKYVHLEVIARAAEAKAATG